jgi:L-seryl-tRNA(Ser) seleniumtransferase
VSRRSRPARIAPDELSEALTHPDRPPSVDAVARELANQFGLPHPLLVEVARAAISAGQAAAATDMAAATERLLLRQVINATGVLLHTNLGRAPLDPLPPAATRYANLELDLGSGERAQRAPAIKLALQTLVGCEDAMVVNNGAGAILLVLSALAAGLRVVVSRGELVEIGGGFRIPDILRLSQAELVEVGTTNITRTADYAEAIDDDRDGDRGSMILVVHQANFSVTGFTQRPAVGELAALGRPLVADLGSGLLDATTPWLPGEPPAWLAGEPAARQTLAAGAQVVTFSGDKLLGGPQAGIIAGTSELVRRCASHPLARALRPGGTVLASLQATLLAYLERDLEGLPFWRMATTSLEDLRARAERVAEGTLATVTTCRSTPGGGSAPGVELESVGLALPGDLRAALRMTNPPIVAHVRDDVTLLDLRTVDPTEDAELARVLRQIAPC